MQTVRWPEPTHTASGGWTVEIGRDLDGKGSGFGHRFWAALGRGDITSVLPSGKCVTSVMYEDRYLHTPVACALLVEVVSALKTHYEPRSAWDAPPVCVRTMLIESKPMRHRGSVWTADWTDDALRNRVLREALAYAGLDAQVISLPKNATRHARLLVVDFDDKTRLRVMLDQGLSYWTVDKNSMDRHDGFLPNGDPKSMGAALGEIRVDLRGHETPTMVVVEPRCMVG